MVGFVQFTPSLFPPDLVPWHGHVRELLEMYTSQAEKLFFAGCVCFYCTMLVAAMVLHWQTKRGIHKVQGAMRAAGLAVPRVAAALRVHRTNSQLGGSSTRETGLLRDIDPQDMLYAHCQDQASSFQTPLSSASAWSMEHRMKEGEHSEAESGLCGLCAAESRESIAQSPIHSDSISVQHFEATNSSNHMGNESIYRYGFQVTLTKNGLRNTYQSL